MDFILNSGIFGWGQNKKTHKSKPMKTPILKRVTMLSLFLVLALIAEGQEKQNIVETEQAEEEQALHILYLDPLSMLLYDKIGLVYSYNTKNIDLQCYGNFIYGDGLFNDTPFYESSVRKWTNQHRSPDEGFELGAQVRIPFKRNWQSQPFAAFIKEKGKVDFFGVWGEIAYKKGDVRYHHNLKE